jgi:ribosome-binding protein aMBF1 (putative translation factor)
MSNCTAYCELCGHLKGTHGHSTYSATTGAEQSLRMQLCDDCYSILPDDPLPCLEGCRSCRLKKQPPR